MDNKKKKIIQTGSTIIIFLLVLSGIWFYGRGITKTPLKSQDHMTFEKACVLEIISETPGKEVSGIAGNQDVKIKILSGSYAGKIVYASNMNGYLYGANCKYMY